MKKIIKKSLLTMSIIGALGLSNSFAAGEVDLNLPMKVKVDESKKTEFTFFDDENPIVEAKELFVDNMSLGIYKTEAQIRNKLNKIASKFIDNKDGEYKILNKIEIKDAYTTITNIRDGKDLDGLLKTGEKISLKKIAKKGERIEDFLLKFDMNFEKLLDKNPDLKEKLQTVLLSKEGKVISDQSEIAKIHKEKEKLAKEYKEIQVFKDNHLLNIEIDEPILKIQVKKKYEEKENIEFSEIFEESSSLYKGQERVGQYGQKGKKTVSYEQTYVNGLKKDRKVTKVKINKRPITEIILRGTRDRGEATGVFLRPTSGYISSPFGYRSSGFHGGIDIANSYGTQVYAADGGKVIEVGYDGSYGNKIVIDHGNGFKTLYAHMSGFTTHVGSIVSKGDLIGYTGSTGNSTGNHLHFEIRVNGSRVNPADYVNF